MRLQIDLLDATSGAKLWGDHYDRKLADLLAVQGQISRDVSQRWRATLGEGGRPAKRCIVSAIRDQAESSQPTPCGSEH